MSQWMTLSFLIDSGIGVLLTTPKLLNDETGVATEHISQFTLMKGFYIEYIDLHSLYLHAINVFLYSDLLARVKLEWD
jgi:hypothetical protein